MLTVANLVGNKTHLRPLPPRLDSLPGLFPVDRLSLGLPHLRYGLLKLLGHVTTDGKLDPTKTLVLSSLAVTQ